MSGEPPIRLEFTTSAPDVAHLPASSTEVAFAGRSNVGKSSLVNAVANRHDLAQVSKTPGRTRLLNVFTATDLAPIGDPPLPPQIVDLPGYGYAKVPQHVRETWGPMIEDYLLTREQLRMVLVLIDGEVGPTKLDLGMLEWVRHNTIPHSVIATKHDKVRSAKRSKRRLELASRCDLDPGDVLWVSASRNVNIDTLRSRIRTWLSD
ncbi:MAG: ribosome biogenesis GTP-binding protein YihA/YsxC [Microthrixaceae bacterium]